MSNPAQSVALELESQASLSLTLGTNLFIGVVRAVGTGIPINCVFVRGVGGPSPIRFMGQVKEIQRPFVNVSIRWQRFQEGDAKMRAIQNTLQAASITGFLDVVANQSEPFVLSQDAVGYHNWSMDFTLQASIAA